MVLSIQASIRFYLLMYVFSGCVTGAEKIAYSELLRDAQFGTLVNRKLAILMSKSNKDATLG